MAQNKFKIFTFLLLFFLGIGGRIYSAPPVFPIRDTGAPFPVNYENYGVFYGTATNSYQYKIMNRSGLAKAMGAGLYPNTSSLLSDPAYTAWEKKSAKDLNPWEFIHSGQPQDDFYAWINAKDVGPATRLLYLGQALADAGHFHQALKAFYAILIHFPREACPSTDHSYYWYVADQALSQIETLVTRHPAEIGYRLVGAQFKVINGSDTDLNNDEFIIDPGHWIKSSSVTLADLEKMRVIQQRGYGKVHLVQYENKQWQLIVQGKPFLIQGVTYSPTPIGQHISSFGNKWMFLDSDENGVVDTPFETWVDKNGNNIQDRGETTEGDFKLMADMGVNAIRLYRMGDENSDTINGEKAALGQIVEYDGREFNKELLRELYTKYGISVILGDFLGAYTIGSGASWEVGTDYTDPVQLENMRSVLTDYVKDHREEPYVLMWLLGNENLMPSGYTGVNATRTQASQQVEAYLRFVDEMAQLIHRLDPDHPVAVGNIDLVHLEDHLTYAPSIDVFGANLYRGALGFGNVWKKVSESLDRPVLITEYGCDSYNSKFNREDQKSQANYHQGNWEDILLHTAGSPSEGNSIGGVAFEFIDEWWKSLKGGWGVHDAEKDGAMAFPDGWASEEWYGLCALGDGSNSPFIRQPRQVYYLYKNNLWKKR